MGLELEYEDGQTPLSEEEKEGLLLKSITTHSELDEHEQLNIEEAIKWTIQNSFSTNEILIEKFIRKLHKKMFKNVWSWAGEFRRSEKNIGVTWVRIGLELRQLLDDTKYWIKNDIYAPDELAIRFKHRLVNIHCFPNGNGRHSRLMADIIVENIFNKDVFTWNYSNMVKAGKIRSNYITAIRQGDKGSIQPLIDFARG